MDMENNNDFEAELKKLDDKIKNAEENEGDTEIRDAVIAKADFYLKNDKIDKAIEIYYIGLKKSIGVARKMDIIIYHYGNLFQHTYIAEGGDWERKNKLKVYEGIYFMRVRKFKLAAEKFIDSLPTFSDSPMLDFQQLVFYTVLTGLISLDRFTIKEKIMTSSEVLTVIRELPSLKPFLESFYKCNYQKFMVHFVDIIGQVQKDRYLSQHSTFYIREVRRVAYQQFLEAYKTVKMENMAKAFGVSVDFIDRELSGFIASRSLNCRIDKVSGIIETQRFDQRNELYQQALKQGDVLLNKVQKLARQVGV